MANPVYHVTFTKNVADIQKRGLDPLSQSLWEKAETGERYQQDPSVYGFSDPKEALNWATKMAWEFEASPSDISILTLEGGDHWQKDPSGDLNLGQSAQQSLRLVEPSEVLDVFSLPEPVGTNAEFQEAVPGGDFEDWKDFYSKRLGSRPPDQSNLPSRITNPGFKFDPSAALVRDADSPDTIRALVSDDKNFAFETLRELKANETSAEATTQAELVSVRKQIYEATQQALSGSPDVITVYRTGPLRGGEPLSFTLDPNFSSDLNLPWAKRLKDPSLRAYTVNKADVLAAPNAVLRSGKGTGNEQELIIAGDKVRSDQSNLPAVIDAAAAASRLALPPDDEPRPKGKAFGSGIGSLMRRRMFPLIQAVQQGYEHLLTEEQKNDLREFLAQPTHEFFGFEKSGLESLKEKLGISDDDMPGETSLSVIEGRKEKPLDEVSQSTLKRRLKAAKNELSDLTGMTVKRDVTNRMEKRIQDLGKEDPLLAKRLDSLVDRIYDLKERINPDTRFGSEVLFGAPPIPPWLKKKNEGTLYEALNSLPGHVRGYTGEILPDEYSIAKALSRLSPDAIRAADRFLKLRDGKGLLDHTFPQTPYGGQGPRLTDTIIQVDPDLPRTDQETVQNRIRNILDPESQSYIRLVDEEPPDTGMAYGGFVVKPLYDS